MLDSDSAVGAPAGLDLLVDPSDLSRIQQILAGLRFKEAVVASGPRTPGVWHYYGCDPSTGQLVHVHLFNRVVTGESFVKSHRLPLDSMLLDNTEALGPVRIPVKAAELVLFVLRNFIKYGSLLDVLRRRHAECLNLEKLLDHFQLKTASQPDQALEAIEAWVRFDVGQPV